MHFIGVALGGVGELTALSIVERIDSIMPVSNAPGQWHLSPDKVMSKYRLMHLEHLPLGTSYVDIAQRIQTVNRLPELLGMAVIVIDYAAVGRPVFDLLRETEITIVGIVTTKTREAQSTTAGYSVPKSDIFEMLNVMIQTRRFVYTDRLKIVQRFELQMGNLQEKPGSSDATTEATLDELVIAVALPVWYAEKTMGGIRDIKTKREEKKAFNPLEYQIGGR